MSYNGKAYHGWQNQPNAISVQEVVEKALSTLLRKEIAIVGAGRTDAGVHAKQMFAHFDFDEKLDKEKLEFKLNSFLPNDIAIHKIFKVKDDTHTRFNAKSRKYLYRVSTEKDVFNFEASYCFKQELDLNKMNQACQILFNYKDFQCFSKSNTDVKTYNCDIMEAHWKSVDSELQFTIKADRFLRNMVRAIVGTMIQIGLGKITLDDFHEIIKSKDRSKAGFSVPAHALYLTEVIYPKDIKI